MGKMFRNISGTEQRPKALTNEGASVSHRSEAEIPLQQESTGFFMTRDSFLKKIVRIGLLAVLSAISVILAGRITFDKCSGCPVSSNCKGKSECKL